MLNRQQAIFRNAGFLRCIQILPGSISLLLLLTLPAKAQNYFGFLTGVNHSNQTGTIFNGNIEFANINNLIIGGVIGTALGKNLDFHFEPVYLRKGAKQTGSDENLGNFSNHFSAYYVDISTLLKYSFRNSSPILPYIMGGVSIALRFDAEFKFVSDNFTATFNANDLIDILDISYTFGSGINIKRDKFSLFIEGRYSVGIVDMFHGGRGYFGGGPLVMFNDYEIKNKGIRIQTGITFPFARKFSNY